MLFARIHRLPEMAERIGIAYTSFSVTDETCLVERAAGSLVDSIFSMPTSFKYQRAGGTFY